MFTFCIGVLALAVSNFGPGLGGFAVGRVLFFLTGFFALLGGFKKFRENRLLEVN